MKRSRSVVALVALGSGVLAGCAAPQPSIEQSTPYAGPVVAFDSSGRTHIATITVPTGGWSIRHDLTRDAWPDAECFVTLISPPQGAMVTQALVEHSVDTQVSTARGCRLLIRRAERVPDKISDGVYREAARVDVTETH